MSQKYSNAGAIPAKAILLSSEGGSIDMIQDGELLASIAIPPGRVLMSDYMALLPEGAWFETDTLAVVVPRSLIASQDFGDLALQSGANPDFRPTSASTMERQMRAMVHGMQARDREWEARLTALQSVERVPQAPAPSPSLEPEPPLVE